ncbi:unnamed protein product [Hermetia illucens]|uniref:Major facilitator superfamily (MFS) profile domain-containing protein n=2 Tax=Hermetia illucens TaxID=343691 RepID=A0A7R8YZ27_HERIL|nr:unnamed protein product [Hermetia illucens]
MSVDTIQKSSGNKTDSIEKRVYHSHYVWTPQEESTLLGAYYYGYVATSLFGGVICERLGARIVSGVCLAINSVLTFLTPVATGVHFAFLFTIRFMNGMFAGIAFPGNQFLIAKWSPPNERAIFTATIIGSSIGTLLTWVMSSLLSEAYGWDWAFYGAGFVSTIVMVFWFIIVFDEPADHWYIREEEREYIQESMKGLIMRKRVWPPFKQVASSVPFYAAIVLHYGHMWNLYFQLTSSPKFFREVLHFRLSTAAFYAGLPYLVRSITVFGFAAAADFIRRNNLLEITFTRKFFCVFSHILPAFTLLIMAAFCSNAYICLGLTTVCMGFNAAAVATNLINVQDLAPNFAATLYGIMNFFANTAGFLAPIMVAAITATKNTLVEWRLIFVINAFFYLIPGFLFIIFGSGELQPWNNLQKPAAYD